MKYYNVGRIINTHGVKGEVKVTAVTDFPHRRFQTGKILYLVDRPGHHIQLQLDGVRTQMQDYLLHFKDYDSIDDVKGMKRKLLQISEKELSPHDLRPGEYYYHQIIGLDVYDLQGRRLGRISHIMHTGANDVWVVDRSAQKPLLLPKIKSVIKKVDLQHHRIEVQLMKGLD